ncbi:MAG: GGDEF domain-containing protein [Rhodobacteraceae bacterium]|nr:GGDEF domain-containing protein [Paracoccaceae bacterium]
MNNRIGKALGVTVVSVALTFLVTICVETLLFGQVKNTSVAMSLVIPPIIAFPVSLFVFGKNDQLQLALGQLHKMHEKARKLAKIDLMTGLLNRNSFIARFENRRRSAGKGALLMLDLDHFKQVNDNFGHQQGDAAIVAVVDCLVQTTREEDVLGRLGGEEFGVFLAHVDAGQARDLAEHIREAVEGIRFEPKPGLFHPLTISIGVVMVEGVQLIDDLIHVADERMYVAKQSGRNRVVTEAVAEVRNGVA